MTPFWFWPSFEWKVYSFWTRSQQDLIYVIQIMSSLRRQQQFTLHDIRMDLNEWSILFVAIYLLLQKLCFNFASQRFHRTLYRCLHVINIYDTSLTPGSNVICSTLIYICFCWSFPKHWRRTMAVAINYPAGTCRNTASYKLYIIRVWICI